jgi:hypothetical protein
MVKNSSVLQLNNEYVQQPRALVRSKEVAIYTNRRQTGQENSQGNPKRRLI